MIAGHPSCSWKNSDAINAGTTMSSVYGNTAKIVLPYEHVLSLKPAMPDAYWPGNMNARTASTTVSAMNQ